MIEEIILVTTIEINYNMRCIETWGFHDVWKLLEYDKLQHEMY